MDGKDLMLGRCPSCAERLTWEDLLIEYEGGDGSHMVFAECHTCGQIVSPD